jgi:hypothetical protein
MQLSRMINDLAAAAYGDSPAGPKIVRENDLVKVGQRRHRLILWLIAARILAIGLGVELWWVDLGPLLKGPFHTAERFGFTRPPDLPEPSARIAEKQVAASVS